MCQNNFKTQKKIIETEREKSCKRETLNLSRDADSSTNTNSFFCVFFHVRLNFGGGCLKKGGRGGVIFYNLFFWGWKGSKRGQEGKWKVSCRGLCQLPQYAQ